MMRHRPFVLGLGVALIAFAFACGTQLVLAGDDPSPDASDGSLGEDSARDGSQGDGGDAAVSADAARRCEVSTPFGIPRDVAIDGPLPHQGFSPHLTADELTLFFWKGLQVYSSTRSSLGSPFSTPVQLESIKADGSVNIDPMVTGDGLELYYMQQLQGASYDLYRAARASTGASFANPVRLDAVNTNGANEFHPFLAADGLWFTRDGQEDGGRNIFLAGPRHPDGGFGAPTVVTALSGPWEDSNPTLSADGLTIYFASSRGDLALEIFTASRQALSVPFSNVTRVDNVNHGMSQAPGWLSADQCRLYIAATDADGNGPYLQVTTRSP